MGEMFRKLLAQEAVVGAVRKQMLAPVPRTTRPLKRPGGG